MTATTVLIWTVEPSATLISLQHTGGGRRNLRVDLVGGDFEERLVALHGVARLLEPLGDGAFEDRLAHLGHDYIGWHVFPFLIARPKACMRESRL